jgi:hypothetical protein
MHVMKGTKVIDVCKKWVFIVDVIECFKSNQVLHKFKVGKPLPYINFYLELE